MYLDTNIFLAVVAGSNNFDGRQTTQSGYREPAARKAARRF
jgi:hypothetical protein